MKTKGCAQMIDKENEQLQKLYQHLKNTGFVLEQQLNERIQALLNNEEVTKLADITSEWSDHTLKALHQYMEVISTILHLPTKDDIANVAKLAIQIEEKLDMLEEHFLNINKSLKKCVLPGHVKESPAAEKKEAEEVSKEEHSVPEELNPLNPELLKGINIFAERLSKKIIESRCKKAAGRKNV